jgi:hypothetical protein
LEEQDQPLEEQEEPRYPTRTRKPLGDWWLNHILPPQGEKQANMAFLGDPSTLGEVLHCEDASKWELAMQEECKAIGTPLHTHVKLPKLTDAQFGEVRAEMQGVLYKAAFGCLMYGPMNSAAVKRVTRYLQGTLGLELQLGGAHVTLQGFCDADWTGDERDRRPTTGYVFELGLGAITWSCKRQPTIAHSTTKAEYMAMSQCTKEAEVIELKYVPTQAIVVDVLTKALGKPQYPNLIEKMGLQAFDHSQSGSVEDHVHNVSDHVHISVELLGSALDVG